MEITIMTPDSGTTSFMRPKADVRITRRACPHKEVSSSTEQVELFLDTDVVDALHALGEDWETHFNAILRDWLRSNPPVIAMAS